jgi:D-ribose pyranase
LEKLMLQRGILNPHILSLVARVRHTNTLVIADRGFPYWPELETVDISLVDDVPTVRQVLLALKDGFTIGAAFMAEEFLTENGEAARDEYAGLLAPIEIRFEPHVEFKNRVPPSVGLIRTGDTTQYGNIILESA